MNREPVRIIGIIGAVIIAVIEALGQQQVLSPDLSTNLVNLIVVLIPIIAAETARRLVTPVADPQTNAGVPLVPKVP